MENCTAVTKKRRRRIGNELIFLPIVIIVLSVVSGLINPNFFKISNLLTIIQQVAVLGIVTGAMLILLISGMIDLSYGFLMGLCGVALCRFITMGLNPYLSLFLMFLIAIAAGALNGFIVTTFKCEPLIITIGTGYLFNGIALVWSQGTYQSLQGELSFIGFGRIGAIPIPMIVLIIVLLIIFVFLKYTPFGRKLYIIGGNADVAFLSGIKVRLYRITAFIIGGLITGLAAYVLSSRIGSALASNGSGYELRALAACIIGGASFSGAKGTVIGSFLGVLLLGVISNSLNLLQVDPFFQTAVLGLIIVVAVIVSNFGNADK